MSKYQNVCPMTFSNSCNISSPYVCTSGSAKGGCSADVNLWQNSNACQSFCKVSGSTGPISRQTRNININNRCPYKLWIGTYGANYSPANGGFELDANKSKIITVPSNWTAGRIWPRTNCYYGANGKFMCETGDCNNELECKVTGNPPASLAEFTLSNNGSDYYDISLVDGYNVPISINPTGNYSKVNNPDLGKFNCGGPGCKSFDMNKCPKELTINGKNGNYCASICTAVNNLDKVKDPTYIKNFNKAQVCCSCNCGANCGCDNPKCQYGCSPLDKTGKGGKCYIEKWPKSSLGIDYGTVFKNQCPDAYSWQFDDMSSTYQCVNADYDVNFC